MLREAGEERQDLVGQGVSGVGGGAGEIKSAVYQKKGATKTSRLREGRGGEGRGGEAMICSRAVCVCECVCVADLSPCSGGG